MRSHFSKNLCNIVFDRYRHVPICHHVLATSWGNLVLIFDGFSIAISSWASSVPLLLLPPIFFFFFFFFFLEFFSPFSCLRDRIAIRTKFNSCSSIACSHWTERLFSYTLGQGVLVWYQKRGNFWGALHSFIKTVPWSTFSKLTQNWKV